MITDHVRVEVRHTGTLDVMESFAPFDSYAAAMDSPVMEAIRGRIDWTAAYISYVAVPVMVVDSGDGEAQDG